MNLSTSVTESTDTREAGEARSQTWENVLWLINDGGLPLPAQVSIHDDGYLSMAFHDLADGQRWVDAMRLDLVGGSVRRPSIDPAKVITYYNGYFRGGQVVLWVHELATVLDEPATEQPDATPTAVEDDTAQRVEPYVGVPQLPVWASRDAQAAHEPPRPQLVGGWRNEDGTHGRECACSVVVDGFDDPADADEVFASHACMTDGQQQQYDAAVEDEPHEHGCYERPGLGYLPDAEDCAGCREVATRAAGYVTVDAAVDEAERAHWAARAEGQVPS